MFSCSVWVSAPSFWMDGGLESRCVGRVYGADGAVPCSWRWAYVPETCRAKNTLIKLPCGIKLAFQIISWGRCTIRQPSSFVHIMLKNCNTWMTWPSHINDVLATSIHFILYSLCCGRGNPLTAKTDKRIQLFMLYISNITSTERTCENKHAQNDTTCTWETDDLQQCFSTAGPRPGTGPWQQLYRAARDSPGICHFSFLSNFHE